MSPEQVRSVSFPTLQVLMIVDAGDGKKKKKKKKPKKKKIEQTDPPRVGLSKFYPEGVFPEGEIQPYTDE